MQILNDEEHAFFAAELGPEKPKRGGRPRAPNRPVFNAIVWVLVSGARWVGLRQNPANPPHQTVQRRFQQWGQDGTWAPHPCAAG